MKSRKSYCTTPGVGVGIGVGVSKKFKVKVFYVMGKALSGELSCPCDRSNSGLSLCFYANNFWKKKLQIHVTFKLHKLLKSQKRIDVLKLCCIDAELQIGGDNRDNLGIVSYFSP